MARQRSAGATVFLVILALILLALALTGKMSDFLATMLKWLLGNKSMTVGDWLKTQNNDNTQTPNANKPTPAKQPSPAPQTNTQPGSDFVTKFFQQNPTAPFAVNPTTHKLVMNPNTMYGQLAGEAPAGGGIMGSITGLLSRVGFAL